MSLIYGLMQSFQCPVMHIPIEILNSECCTVLSSLVVYMQLPRTLQLFLLSDRPSAQWCR